MIASVQTINFRGAHYLTELAYCPKMPTDEGGVLHFFVSHPGASDADALMISVDESYRPPHRYHPLVVVKTFLSDYRRMSRGHAMFVPRAQIKILHGIISSAQAADDTIKGPEDILALEDYYRPITISAMLTEMQNARHRSWTP